MESISWKRARLSSVNAIVSVSVDFFEDQRWCCFAVVPVAFTMDDGAIVCVIVSGVVLLVGDVDGLGIGAETAKESRMELCFWCSHRLM